MVIFISDRKMFMAYTKNIPQDHIQHLGLEYDLENIVKILKEGMKFWTNEKWSRLKLEKIESLFYQLGFQFF